MVKKELKQMSKEEILKEVEQNVTEAKKEPNQKTYILGKNTDHKKLLVGGIGGWGTGILWIDESETHLYNAKEFDYSEEQDKMFKIMKWNGLEWKNKGLLPTKEEREELLKGEE